MPATSIAAAAARIGTRIDARIAARIAAFVAIGDHGPTRGVDVAAHRATASLGRSAAFVATVASITPHATADAATASGFAWTIKDRMKQAAAGAGCQQTRKQTE